MSRFLKALIRTLIEFVIFLIAILITLGIAKYIIIHDVFIILLLVGFLLCLILKTKYNDYL